MENQKSFAIGKNVSLTPETLNIIQGYMGKTRQNFSATLVKIIQEWDKFSIELERYKYNQIEKDAQKQINDIKKARIEKT